MRYVMTVVIFFLCINGVYANISISKDENNKAHQGFVSDFPNESINLMSGELTYRYVDLKIPGVNGLDMEVVRSFSSNGITDSIHPMMGQGWIIETPRIMVVDISETGKKAKCLGGDIVYFALPDGKVSRSVGFANSNNLPVDYEDDDIVLSGNKVFDCSEMKMRLPNGTQIVFGHESTWSLDTFNLSVKSYYASVLSDRFGNSITYNYDYVDYADGVIENAPQLESMISSAGDVINFYYQESPVGDGFPRLARIVSGNREVKYSYNSDGRLQEVADPEARKTKYTWSIDQGGGLNYYNIASIQTPEGAEINYDYTNKKHSDDYCESGWQCSYKNTVESKVITGVELPLQKIDYTRIHTSPETGNGEVVVEVSHSTNDVITPTAPEKQYKYHFLRRESYSDDGSDILSGNLRRFEVLKRKEGFKRGSGVVFEIVYSNDIEWGHRVKGLVGCTSLSLEEDPEQYQKKCGEAFKKSLQETFYEEDGIYSFQREFLTKNVYNFPNEILESTSYSEEKNRYLKYAYVNDRNNWIIGLPRFLDYSQDSDSWIRVKQYDYYSWDSTKKRSLKKYSEFGTLKYTYSEYHPSGELKLLNDNVSGNFHKYENYKHGEPTLITTRKRYESSGVKEVSRAVDDFGNVTSYVDYDGNVTRYYYDKLSRITNIEQEGDESKWEATSISYYDPVGQSRGLILESHPGSYKYKYLDGFGREVEIVDEDKRIGTVVSKHLEYSAFGNLLSESIPMFGREESSTSISYSYDTLNRKIGEVLNDNGYSRSWRYLVDNVVEYTDGVGNISTTGYYSRGFQSDNLPISFVSDEGSISLEYDIFNNLITVDSNNELKERSYYDDYNKLCRKSRTDTGDVIFSYNEAGQLVGVTKEPFAEDSGCAGHVLNDQNTISYEYDYNGDLHRTLLRGEVYRTQIFDEQGNLEQKITPETSWTYKYNDIGLMVDETLEIDGRFFQIIWEYDSAKFVSQITYPDNEVVDIVSDGFGRPIQIRGYLKTVEYFANGNPSLVLYENDSTSIYVENSWGVLEQVCHYFSGSGESECQSISFDQDMNVDLIDNRLQGEVGNDYLSAFQYDGLNRLVRYKDNLNLQYLYAFEYDQYSNLISIIEDGVSIQVDYDYQTGLPRFYDEASTGLEANGEAQRYYFSHDDYGNLLSDGEHNYTYNLLNELVSGGRWDLTYDGNGLYTKREGPDKDKYFVYSSDGLLRHKLEVDGVVGNYIYLGDREVARNFSIPKTGIEAVDDYYSMWVERCSDYSVLENDIIYEPTGDGLFITSVDNPDSQIVGNGKKVRYCSPPQPPPGGTAKIYYEIEDGNGNTDGATVFIEIKDP